MISDPKVLIADDDPGCRRVLEASLATWGYSTISVENGAEALLRVHDTPSLRLVLVDWMMPMIDGITFCRLVRERLPERNLHIIQVTARTQKADLVAALTAGADDYLSKPFDGTELRARIGSGIRMTAMRDQLVEQVAALRLAQTHVKRLQGLLPICMHCKKIRNDQQSWQSVEQYVSEHSEAAFSHGVCGECLDVHYPGTDEAETNA